MEATAAQRAALRGAYRVCRSLARGGTTTNMSRAPQVEKADAVSFRLLSGTAEMFGSELPMRQEIVFDNGGAGCIYTWHGCEVEVYGKPGHIYMESDTTMHTAFATHDVLEARRRRARESKTDNGPRVLVAGPADSGKSTIVRQLLAYATRMEWKPTLVDMDLGAGMIGVPGSFGAALIDEPPPINAALAEAQALHYFYGSMNPNNNKELMQLLLGQLAMNINARQGMQEHERCSGCIINTMATAQPGQGDAEYRFILDIIAALEVDVVIALNQRLFRDLEAAFKSNPKISVVMLKKSDGIPARSAQARTLALKQSVKDYYYGIPDGTLSPKRVVYGYVDLDIYQLGGVSSVSRPNCLVHGAFKLICTDATAGRAGRCCIEHDAANRGGEFGGSPRFDAGHQVEGNAFAPALRSVAGRIFGRDQVFSGCRLRSHF